MSCSSGPVGGMKCWQLTFLQTTDVFKLVHVIGQYQHFHNMCHTTFTLPVYDLTVIGGDCGAVMGKKVAKLKPQLKTVFLHFKV